MKKRFYPVFFMVLFMFLVGCAGIPVREEVKVDLNLPVGKIEGNRFTGLRYPFNVSAPPGWKVTMEIPPFMEELGYQKPGLEESEVFIFNPLTRSNVQIDFTPAGRYSKFSQESIEWLTNAAAGGLMEELKDDYGKDLKVTISPTERILLKGVPYAAKKYATYTVKGVTWKRGYIYAFSEPYQIFILYMILEKEGIPDSQDIQKILDSFEVISRK
ncbi:MAG: hypothetical protein FJ115_02265 [Deltaproteobacteria bacterium]|nr:hypothetical protein [Deltaproteobacteria bacterium]